MTAIPIRATALTFALLLAALGSVCLAQTVQPPVQQSVAAQPTPSFEITGAVKSGTTPLPGVTVSAANSLTGKRVVTSTDLDGSYRLAIPAKGKWVVRAEMMAFAAQTAEVRVNPETPAQKADFSLILLSRVPKTEDQSSQEGAPQLAGTRTNQRGTQRLSLSVNENGDGLASVSPGDSLPTGASTFAQSADAVNESFSVSGQNGRTQDYGQRSMEDMRDRMEELRASGRFGEMGGFGGPGGPGGPGGFGGPGGGPFIISRARGFNPNRPHGMVYYDAGNSALDAAPYSLSGSANSKPEYGSNRFGGMVGGPLKIPHVFDDGGKTFVFMGYNGTRASTPYDVFSHVPTELERSGDFSQSVYTSGPNAGSAVQLYDPSTGALLGSQLPSSSISSAAQGLLAYIPLPNQPGKQNFRYSSSADTVSDSGDIRIVHNFGSSSPNMVFGPGPGPGGPPGMGAFGRRSSRPHNNLNAGVNFMRSRSDQLRPFPGLGGTNKTNGLNANVGWSMGRGRSNNMLRVNWNRNLVHASNVFSNLTDAASLLGIAGASSDPADWGIPGISFSNFSGLSTVGPETRNDQSIGVSEIYMMMKGKHSIRFGGDYRRLWTDVHSNSNPNGTFTFTGYATAAHDGTTAVAGTGYDFADFLLGHAQQTTIQYSQATFHFRGNSYSAFIHDDWRARGNLTLQLGLRYEYMSPFTETENRLVNLDAAQGFTSVSAVEPGDSGPYSGKYPDSLVRPDRNNFAPRLGIAWRLKDSTVVRAGYGINYNLGQYRSIVQQLAFQPPFSFTQTNIASLPTSLTFSNGFPATSNILTNNYGIDPNYRLGYVQMWNLNIQRQLPGQIVMNVGYTGSKGTGLDIVRAPNRTPTGLRIPDIQAFLWESSEGSSILHSGSIRVRRRMHTGIQIGGTYTYSKSIDNASSIGGGTSIVAQNDLDLAAERGLSSFDQRHRFTTDFLYEFPFGTGKQWLANGGEAAKIFGDWTFSGDFTLASGTPFTARVIGDFTDVARGSNGSLRADYNGLPIELSSPGVAQWFNTAAFTVPATGDFGTAGRNTIEGPGTILLNFGLSKNIPVRDNMNLEFRAQASNVLNHANFTAIDTTVNSPTFGQVISVGSMRRISLSMRLRI